MEKSTFTPIRYKAKGDRDFGITVRNRVNEYFKSNNISRKGDYRVWLKLIILPLMYLVPFGLIMTNWYSQNLLIFYGLWLLMGIGLAGCGMGIMHDACHGAITKNKTFNNFIGALILNLAGGSTFNWKIQHNVLHHTYTNIDGYDEDITAQGLIRLSPRQPVKSIYRFQIFYAWFFYGLMTFFWSTFKDFFQLSRYHKMDLLKTQSTTYPKELIRLIFVKILYHSFFIVLPILFLEVAWWHVILGWFSMHFVAGLILGCVFQPAHAVPTSAFPLPDENKLVKGDWAKYQLLTTANFAPKNKILSWYIGGLNYQIEHHLFPNICHIHHPQISKIVKATAKEFGLPYHSQPTFRAAIFNHAKLLYELRK